MDARQQNNDARATRSRRPWLPMPRDKYPELKRMEILQHCRKEYEPVTEPRQPTSLEWEIVHGIVEGDVVIRRLPQFLPRVCMGENLLRFQLTIKAQVEGHLLGRLNDSTPIYANHQTTERLVDAIVLAARQRREHDDQLVPLLREVKRVEYHAGTHSLNYVFFMRADAVK